MFRMDIRYKRIGNMYQINPISPNIGNREWRKIIMQSKGGFENGYTTCREDYQFRCVC